MECVTVYAPGSIANLGPGFDCLGAAIAGAGDRVTARRGTRPGVVVTRVSDERIPREADRNTASLAAHAALQRAGWDDAGLELEIDKGLPLSGGLGGSAASAVAGALAADRLLSLGLDQAALIECALAGEARAAGRHADNVAPCLLGGAVLVRGLDPPLLTPVRVDPAWTLVLATPDYAVETARARQALPAQVPRADAIRQAANLGALLLTLERADGPALRSALEDLLAEPARVAAGLYPGYVEARAAAYAAGALGVVISGAGPTVLAFTWDEHAKAVGAALASAYAGAGYTVTRRVTKIDPSGARVL